MPSLKSIKNRIKSVKSTQKITKAMKMVAASKLKRAREHAESASEYASKLHDMVLSIASGIDPSSSERIQLLHGNGKDNTHLIIVSSSDRGLCGSFNHSISKAVKHKIAELSSAGKKVKLMCIGKKAYEIFKSEHADKIVKRYDHIAGKTGVDFNVAKEIADHLIEQFEAGAFDVCTVFFNRFQSAIAQIPTAKQLVPLEFDVAECEVQHGCEFEPDEEEIVERLMPKNIAVQMFTALLENNASEHAARMTAMDNATRNSGEMIKKLNLVYNRTRQAYITKELIEIISGAEAV